MVVDNGKVVQFFAYAIAVANSLIDLLGVLARAIASLVWPILSNFAHLEPWASATSSRAPRADPFFAARSAAATALL
jgi:hypothetical protein